MLFNTNPSIMISFNNSDILRAVTFENMLIAMEAAILANETQQTHTPPRTHINVEKNTLLMMPCFGKKYFSVKLVSVFPDNASKNIPIIFGTVMLNDRNTGQPLAMLDGKTITALRTGAIGGLSVKYLSPVSLENIGIIGTGIQGLYQTLFACHVRKYVKNIYLFNRSAGKLEWFAKQFKLYFPHIQLHFVDSSATVLENAQLIITATTAANPLLPDSTELLKGKHFLAVGSYKPDMRELPDALFSLTQQVYVDTFHAIEESGDLAIPIEKGLLKTEQISTLAHHIEQQILPSDEQQTTLFKSVGLAVFDLFAAALIYEKALEQGIGQQIVL